MRLSRRSPPGQHANVTVASRCSACVRFLPCVTCRMVRPPLHPGKPIAAGEQQVGAAVRLLMACQMPSALTSQPCLHCVSCSLQMQASSSPSVTDAKESRSSDADPPSSLARQLEGPTSAVQTADPCHTKLLTDAAMATPMVTENLPNVPAPVLPTNPGVTDQLMDGTAAATAPATGKAAASLEPKTV
jgi:hypothetical protein